ncbi:hypothetical protein SDC9_188520 [bioreactor metagenome]|uniref:Uncharacterized protein n=1 Tax=bioreactor metagenome TaxID=1076179 RepID=A0A645HQ52_9ZZZZ
MQPVLADLPRLAIGHELVGVEGDVEVEVVVDHDLKRLTREALAPVGVDGFAVDAPFRAIAVGVDAPARG